VTAPPRVVALLLAAAAAGAGLAAGRPAGAQAPVAGPGEAVFAAKQCVRCHVPGGRDGLPALERLRRPQGEFELAGRLWNHAPAMFTTLVQEGIAWPPIEAPEMADLMAYLGATAARDSPPDLFAGRAALVRKECLKCHTLRGEGGGIAPELAHRRPIYSSASAWAAAMWRHTPAMALRALEVGVMYPRFSGDEMRNLVAFLRGASR
jgi:mono/diheme cytochrome c family protein